MIAMRTSAPLAITREKKAQEPRCWCELEADYTLELVNARVGTGRFQRCRHHTRLDLETGDFKVVEAWI